MRETIVFFTALAFTACQPAGDGSTPEASTTVVPTATEEVKEGAPDTPSTPLSIEVSLDEALNEKGLALGNSTALSTYQVSIYLMATRNVVDTLMATAVDADGAELGRARVVVNMKADDAGYFKVWFPRNTVLKTGSKVTLR